MSIRLMTITWDLPMDHAHKLVALSLADNASDEGQCFPSVARICARCNLSERKVQGVLAELEAAGFLVRHFRSGRSTLYTITPARYAPPHGVPPAQDAPTPAQCAPSPPHSVHPTPAQRAPITVTESSVESSPMRDAHAGEAEKAWEEIKTQYPRFTGKQDWLMAERSAYLRVAEGAMWQQLREGVGRYAEFVRGGGVSSPRFVMTPGKFFSDAERPWAQPWELPDASPVPAKKTGFVTHDQRERAELSQLMNRRSAIGLADFRDPHVGESSSHYRNEQDAEWSRRRANPHSVGAA